MKDNKSLSIKKPSILFLSFFGIGFVKFAPGTAGTLATLPFLYLISLYDFNLTIFIVCLIVLTIFSCWLAEKVQQQFNLHDPQWIVMDEVLGMATTWCFSKEYSLTHLIIQFCLFRFFDIIKFWPASYFDKKVTHGCGTILDDIISGVFAGLVYLLILTTGII